MDQQQIMLYVDNVIIGVFGQIKPIIIHIKVLVDRNRMNPNVISVLLLVYHKMEFIGIILVNSNILFIKESPESIQCV